MSDHALDVLDLLETPPERRQMDVACEECGAWFIVDYDADPTCPICGGVLSPNDCGF